MHIGLTERKMRALATNSLRYYYRNKEDLLAKKRAQYNSQKGFNKVAKQLSSLYEAIAYNGSI